MNIMKDFKKIFKNKRIFLTGHTGFKGAWFSIILNIFEAKIYGFSLKPKKNSLFNDCSLEKFFFRSIYADIRDYKKLYISIKKFRPQVLVHMAAQPLVRLAYKNPRETFEINSVGTLNVLEIVKKLKFIKNILIITSDKVYENRNKPVEFIETDKLGSFDPYSNSKASAELITTAYRESFFKNSKINAITVRAGNVIGGGDYAEDRIIPDFFRALKKKNLYLRQPKAIRPWQHVFDPLYGYLILLKKMLKKEKIKSNEYNFGPNKSNFINVLSLITKINQKIGNRIKINIKKNKKKENMENTVLMLNSSRSRRELNWKTYCSINQSLNLISEWYKNKKKKGNIYNFSKNQIKEYFSSIKTL